MKIDIDILKKSPLFIGIAQEEIEKIMPVLESKMKVYQKNEMILGEEEPVENLGVILEGCVQVICEDVFGNRSILEQLGQGELFGAAFSCAGIKKSPVSVVTVTDCTVLQVPVKRLFELSAESSLLQQKFFINMVQIFARKNVMLGEKIRHISKRSTRDKLLSYLSEQSKRAGSRHFTIPFNRQELADYLCVERSAMSAELGKLKKEGILDMCRSEFWLK